MENSNRGSGVNSLHRPAGQQPASPRSSLQEASNMQRSPNRIRAGALSIFILLAAQIPIANEAGAGAVCGLNQSLCGDRCYSASSGQTCTDGMVCELGQSLCGKR